MQPIDGADDPFALLARFQPGPGRSARAVVHPRLTFLPCAGADQAALAATFSMEVPVAVVTPADLQAFMPDDVTRAERAAAYDDLIQQIEDACRRAGATAAAVETTERALHEARTRADRIADQRARADELVHDAASRLDVLTSAERSEVELRRELEQARAAYDAATVAYSMVAEQPTGGVGVDLPTALAVLAQAEQSLASATAEHREAARAGHPDASALQLDVWAAQRTVELAREGVARARAARAAPVEGRGEIEAARLCVDEAHARVVAAERALDARVDGAPADMADADAEAAELRRQITTVRSAIEVAERDARAATAAAEAALADARRQAAGAVRDLRVVLERAEPTGEVPDPEGILTRLRTRRRALDAPADDGTAGLLRRVCSTLGAPLVLLVEPFPDPPADLLDALCAISASTRVVYVTDHPAILDAAREVDPVVGAVRIALDTTAPNAALASTFGNLL